MHNILFLCRKPPQQLAYRIIYEPQILVNTISDLIKTQGKARFLPSDRDFSAFLPFKFSCKSPLFLQKERGFLQNIVLKH